MEERMDAIVPFNFGDQPIRIEDRGGAPWFVLADVCRVLGLANVGDAAARVRDSERDDIALTDAIGREQMAIAVNEAGLYRLIMRSRKPAAERFSDWVVGEMLPSIRKTGSYGAPAQH
jgi:anti-repressor protein